MPLKQINKDQSDKLHQIPASWVFSGHVNLNLPKRRFVIIGEPFKVGKRQPLFTLPNKARYKWIDDGIAKLTTIDHVSLVEKNRQSFDKAKLDSIRKDLYKLSKQFKFKHPLR